jgi:glycosyltransferase involved in cell wall biosynthesis
MSSTGLRRSAYTGVARAEAEPGVRTDASNATELSVVVAVYGCVDCLGTLHERLVHTLEGLVESFELVFVDDGSPDGAWGVIARLASEDSRVRAVRLSRNFGQHAAITAGLAESRGRLIVVMDCDLQDPPEEIPRLYERALAGYDIVLARRKRRRDSVLRRAAARSYFRLLSRLVGTHIEGEFGTFSIISRPVRDAYLSIGDRGRHYLFILHWLGFEQAAIDVQHAPRAAGQSAYTFGKLVRHAIDGVLFQTTVLLRWIVYFGFLIALGGVLLAAVFAGIFFLGNPPPGWTSLAVIILVIGGFIIMSTGVTGLYIGKIFDQVKGRPLYVVRDILNGADQ